MRTVRATVREFWSFVQEEPERITATATPCWEWVGPHAYNGYMSFRSTLAHRAAATIYCERIPSAVSQRCNNKKCMRLDHFAIAVDAEETETRYTPIHKQKETIEKVLAARGNGRYTIDGIKQLTGLHTVTIRKVLREAPLYDLLADIKRIRAKGDKPQVTPNKKAELQHA